MSGRGVGGQHLPIARSRWCPWRRSRQESIGLKLATSKKPSLWKAAIEATVTRCGHVRLFGVLSREPPTTLWRKFCCELGGGAAAGDSVWGWVWSRVFFFFLLIYTPCAWHAGMFYYRATLPPLVIFRWDFVHVEWLTGERMAGLNRRGGRTWRRDMNGVRTFGGSRAPLYFPEETSVLTWVKLEMC